MNDLLPQPLVKSSWLALNLNKVKIVDGSFYLPAMGRNAQEEYNQARIPGAVFFDIRDISQKDTNLPFMLPPKEQFESQVSDLGLTENDQIVVYDGLNIFSACRIYWMFKYFGHKNISVLDGGFQNWKKQQNTVDVLPPQTSIKQEYHAQYKPEILCKFDHILENIKKIKDGSQDIEKVIDTRPADRVQESGQMPFSLNIPFSSLINPNTGEMINEDEIKDLLSNRKLDWKNEKIIVSCASGISSAIMFVALERIGVQNKALYDGSWSEYSSHGDKVEIVKSQ